VRDNGLSICINSNRFFSIVFFIVKQKLNKK